MAHVTLAETTASVSELKKSDGDRRGGEGFPGGDTESQRADFLLRCSSGMRCY